MAAGAQLVDDRGGITVANVSIVTANGRVEAIGPAEKHPFQAALGCSTSAGSPVKTAAGASSRVTWRRCYSRRARRVRHFVAGEFVIVPNERVGAGVRPGSRADARLGFHYGAGVLSLLLRDQRPLQIHLNSVLAEEELRRLFLP